MGIALKPKSFIRIGIACAMSLAGVLGAHGECKGSPPLAAKVHAHPDAANYTELGTWFGEHQQFDCANQAFRSALKLAPTSAKLNYFLGLSLYTSGQVEPAIAPLQQSVQLDARALQPRLLLATIQHQQGRRNEAEQQWRAALQIDPTSKPALDGLANSLIDNGDMMAAIDLLRNAKRDEDLTLDLARAYGLVNMLNEAAATVQSALDADPSSLRLNKALVTVLVHQHRYQDAAAVTQKYLDQHPNDVAAQISHLHALVLNNDSANARRLGTKLLTTAPHDFDVLYLNGILEREAGEYATARDHLQEAVALQPNDYSACYNLGTALAHLDDATGAKLQLEKAVALDPSKAEAHFQLASVLRALDETQAAQDQLTIYKQLSSASVALSQSDTKSKLADQSLAAGDAKQAAALYREAVADTPDNALLHYKLAVSLDQAGDTIAERAALEQAVRLDPTLAIAQNQLGYLASRVGDSASAEKSFRLAVTAAPAFTEAWINLAATLAEETRIADAQQAVATALQIDPNNPQAVELSRQLAAAAQRSAPPK